MKKKHLAYQAIAIFETNTLAEEKKKETTMANKKRAH